MPSSLFSPLCLPPYLQLNAPSSKIQSSFSNPIFSIFFSIFSTLLVSGSALSLFPTVTLDDQLSFAANIVVTTCSCRFILHIIRRIPSFLTQEAAEVLLQALVIDFCNSLLAGVSAWRLTSAVHLECSSSAGLQPSHTSPLLCTLHWLLVAAQI